MTRPLVPGAKRDERTKFERCHAFVQRWEGGFADHPSDPGGTTNYGVSLRFLRSIGKLGDIDGDGDVTEADIRALTPETAAAILKIHFWDPLSLDRLPTPLALVVYDTAVNMGPGVARRLVQEALLVKVDGIWGPKTWAALFSCDPGRVAHSVIRLRRGRYSRLINAKPELQAFYQGWSSRVFSLERAMLEV